MPTASCPTAPARRGTGLATCSPCDRARGPGRQGPAAGCGGRRSGTGRPPCCAAGRTRCCAWRRCMPGPVSCGRPAWPLLAPDASASGDRASLADAWDDGLHPRWPPCRAALPGGLRALIEPTAALVAIDCDMAGATAGRDAKPPKQEAANRAALPALARQIRLRNLSGAILIDLAGLSLRRRPALAERMRAALAPDPASPACSASPQAAWRRSSGPASTRRCTRCSPAPTPPAWPPCARSPPPTQLRRQPARRPRRRVGPGSRPGGATGPCAPPRPPPSAPLRPGAAPRRHDHRGARAWLRPARSAAGKPDPTTRPFCSPRCADVDLGRWFTGQYRVPARPEEEERGEGA